MRTLSFAKNMASFGIRQIEPLTSTLHCGV